MHNFSTKRLNYTIFNDIIFLEILLNQVGNSKTIVSEDLLDITIISCYTPNGYIVPAEFGIHFFPRLKNVQKQAKLHLNEIGLTNNEFCKKQL